MSQEKVLCSHEPVIRFDQLGGNRVNWDVTPGDAVWNATDSARVFRSRS